MRAPTKKAGAGTPATENKQRNRAYPKDVPLSSLKIGELLLLLLAENESPNDWQQFGRLLHQFYEVGAL